MLSINRLRVLPWKSLLRRCTTELVHKDTVIEKLRNSYKLDEQQNLVVPVFKKAMLYPDDVAIKDNNGEFTYFQLYITAKKLSIQISNICGSGAQARVAFLCPSNALWIIVQWGCWISGQVAVPFEPNLPQEQLQRNAADCKVRLVIATPECETAAQQLAQQLEAASIIMSHAFVPSAESVSSTAVYTKQLVGLQGTVLTESTLSNEFYSSAPAMLLYTPNSVSRAVRLTHRNVEAQMRCLIASWQMTSNDCMLSIFSMHRMHAALGALLSLGGNLVMQPHFDSNTAWSALLGINNPSKQRVTLFMAVPQNYKRLIVEYDKMFAKDSRMSEYILNHCKNKVRLMATAYEVLPETVYRRWREITGQNIYEHYGTLETGLVLGQPLDNKCAAVEYRHGTQSSPLSGISARLVGSDGRVLVKCKNKPGAPISYGQVDSDDFKTELDLNFTVGQLEIACEHLCADYFDAEVDETAAASEPLVGPQNKYFQTCDIFSYQHGSFQFLSKADEVFTVGGHKVYGSEIKRVLIAHPSIKDVAVLGIPNNLWGHRLGVICILSPDAQIDTDHIKIFCDSQLPAHKRPAVYKTIFGK